MTFYSGAIPYGQNEKGYWFGKNGGFPSVLGPTYHIDGIAQAFEKPEHPYLLKQVVMDCGILEVVGDVDMYCKVYKIDEIPAYVDDDYVTLPDEPGELIAKGRAHLTPSTYEETSGLVSFSLFGEEDGLEFDITPSIVFMVRDYIKFVIQIQCRIVAGKTCKVKKQDYIIVSTPDVV